MQYLKINMNKLNNKPSTMGKKDSYCYFCDMDFLLKNNKILDIENNMILMENKFPSIQQCYQLVLIENNTCQYNISNYPKCHLYNLFSYIFKHWIYLLDQDKYKSISLFKNHGTYSSGSIYHPHMQFICFENHDCNAFLKDSDFQGIHIASENSVKLNMSTTPKLELYEFNISINDLNDINIMANYSQIITHYILNTLNEKNGSFNMFFYKHNDSYIIKIVSRGVMSVLTVGYHFLFQITNIDEIVNDIKDIYF